MNAKYTGLKGVNLVKYMPEQSNHKIVTEETLFFKKYSVLIYHHKAIHKFDMFW